MSKLCQLCVQATDLIEHVHQNLSMSHLNGQDMINVRQMSESSEVVGGGTSASVVATLDASAASAPVEKGGGGTTPIDAPLGREGPTLK